MIQCISSHMFDFRNYWNRELNKGEFLIIPLFILFQVLASSADNVKCFTRNFCSTFTLRLSGVTLPKFPLRIDFLLSDMCRWFLLSSINLIPTKYVHSMISLQLSKRSVFLNWILFSLSSTINALLRLASLSLVNPPPLLYPFLWTLENLYFLCQLFWLFLGILFQCWILCWHFLNLPS